MLDKITDKIFYYINKDETERPGLGLVCGDDCCLVINAGNSPKHAKDPKNSD